MFGNKTILEDKKKSDETKYQVSDSLLVRCNPKQKDPVEGLYQIYRDYIGSRAGASITFLINGEPIPKECFAVELEEGEEVFHLPDVSEIREQKVKNLDKLNLYLDTQLTKTGADLLRQTHDQREIGMYIFRLFNLIEYNGIGFQNAKKATINYRYDSERNALVLNVTSQQLKPYSKETTEPHPLFKHAVIETELVLTSKDYSRKFTINDPTVVAELIRFHFQEIIESLTLSNKKLAEEDPEKYQAIINENNATIQQYNFFLSEYADKQGDAKLIKRVQELKNPKQINLFIDKCKEILIQLSPLLQQIKVEIKSLLDYLLTVDERIVNDKAAVSLKQIINDVTKQKSIFEKFYSLDALVGASNADKFIDRAKTRLMHVKAFLVEQESFVASLGQKPLNLSDQKPISSKR